MARKREVELTEKQKRRNQRIFDRLKADRERLYEETRQIQQAWKKRRAELRRKHTVSGSETAAD